MSIAEFPRVLNNIKHLHWCFVSNKPWIDICSNFSVFSIAPELLYGNEPKFEVTQKNHVLTWDPWCWLIKKLNVILNKSSCFLVLATHCKGSEVVSIGRIPTAAAGQGMNLNLSTGGRTHVHRNRLWGLPGGSPRASGEVKVAQLCPTLCDPMDYTWRWQWHPTPVLWPGKSHGRRSLEGCSPWGRWGSDTTERLRFHFSLSCIGEGNGNPLQCSCLENPRDRGSWWAAVYGVAQSWTRLKRLGRQAGRTIQSMESSRPGYWCG